MCCFYVSPSQRQNDPASYSYAVVALVSAVTKYLGRITLRKERLILAQFEDVVQELQVAGHS